MKAGLAVLLAVASSLLAGCATPQPTLPWPEALHADGVPAIPLPLAQATRGYTAIAGHALVDWHPVRPELLLAHRPAKARTAQLFRLDRPLGPLAPLTAGADPVTRSEWEPEQGRVLVFARSQGGDEADQWFRLDPDTGVETLLTAPGQRHALQGWLRRSGRMLMLSVPLDRTAREGRRERLETELSAIDPLAPANRRVLARLPGIGWGGAAIAVDERRVALTRTRSTTESEIWLFDLDTPGAEPVRLLPSAARPVPAVYKSVAFAPNGRSLLLLTDSAGEFRELARLDLADLGLTRLTTQIAWDITMVEPSPDGQRLALRVNASGRGELHLLDAASGTAVPTPPLPAGSIERLRWHPASGALAVQTDSARGPGQIHVLHPDAPVAWTRPAVPAGIDLSGHREAQAMHWRGADGLALSGWITRPDPARFAGPRPVVILVHGGPAAQADDGWLGRNHYLVESLGYTLLRPNVRGSMGFGKRFLALDDGFKREDAVHDLGTLLDWLAVQPELDPGRVVVMGGSYGGYMSMAASVHFADRIAGAVATVGISNFVSFLERTESYRRDPRRQEYGDERDPAMRAFLQRISPLNQVDRIAKPLLVVQGRNDPRVPWTEAEQIVRRLQQRGTPVWYLLADNEGHGFARRENADAYFATVVQFLQRTLGR